MSFYSFDDGYDVEKYIKMTFKAVETLLLPLGYDETKLKKYLG